MPQDTGIVLKTYPLGETGLIVVWSTADHGIIRTAARTALKPGGDFFGRLDLFFEAELLWETAKTGDLDHLKSVSLLNPRLALRNSFPKLRLAGYMTKLLLATVESRTPIPEIHLMLHRALNYLETRTATRHIMQHFEKRLAEEHGMYRQGMPAIAILRSHYPHVPADRDALYDALPPA